MSGSLEAGVSTKVTVLVDRDRTIGFMGEDARVYATPALVQDIEQTCRDLIKEHVGDDQDSVGFEVAIKHLAPTLLGMNATISATIVEVDGPKVVFDISASDSLDTICAGRHVRFVVGVEKTKQRLLAKAQKQAEAAS